MFFFFTALLFQYINFMYLMHTSRYNKYIFSQHSGIIVTVNMAKILTKSSHHEIINYNAIVFANILLTLTH